MKIAVTYQNGDIFQHFGHTEQFKIYTAENGEVLGSFVANTDVSGHSALTEFLAAREVDVLICGGIGESARETLKAVGIELCAGVSGSADEAVRKYLETAAKP